MLSRSKTNAATSTSLLLRKKKVAALPSEENNNTNTIQVIVASDANVDTNTTQNTHHVFGNVTSTCTSIGEGPFVSKLLLNRLTSTSISYTSGSSKYRRNKRQSWFRTFLQYDGQIVSVFKVFFSVAVFGLIVYCIGTVSYWSFHHLQCYSREMNVQWEEGIAHTVRRNHTCPKPVYYSNSFDKDNETLKSRSDTDIDPSRICITSLSDADASVKVKVPRVDDNNATVTSKSFFTVLSNLFTIPIRCRDFTNVEHYTWPVTVKYCQKHGYTCYESSHLLDVTRPPAWSKIKAVYNLLTNTVLDDTDSVHSNHNDVNAKETTILKRPGESTCEWVLWMDADTIIMNSDVRIQDLLPPPPPPVPVDTTSTSSAALSNTINLIVTYDRRFTANSGIWLIRNSYWSHIFLRNWWNMTNFVRYKGFSLSGDNQAFGYLLDTTYNLLSIKTQLAMQNEQSIDNVDITNLISSGPIRMIPRCQMNSFGVFIANTVGSKSCSYNDSAISCNSSNTSNDQLYHQHLNSDQFYHYGDFIAHASGIDKKEAGVQLLLHHTIW